MTFPCCLVGKCECDCSKKQKENIHTLEMNRTQHDFGYVHTTVVDPGFPIGGPRPRRGGRGLPRRLHFENFVCQNERIWTLRRCVRQARPLDPPTHNIKIPSHTYLPARRQRGVIGRLAISRIRGKGRSRIYSQIRIYSNFYEFETLVSCRLFKIHARQMHEHRKSDWYTF